MSVTLLKSPSGWGQGHGGGDLLVYRRPRCLAGLLPDTWLFRKNEQTSLGLGSNEEINVH